MKIMLVSAIGLWTALGVVADAQRSRRHMLRLALPSKPADNLLSYGTDANQFGEVSVSHGPVAILKRFLMLRDLAPWPTH